MIALTLAAALLQTPNPCHAAGAAAAPAPACPRWRRVENNEQGQGYVDTASVRRDGRIVEIGLRVELRAPGPGGGRVLDSRIRFDCATRTKRMVHLAVHDAAGRTLVEAPVTTDPAAPPPAGSLFATLLREYCQAGGAAS